MKTNYTIKRIETMLAHLKLTFKCCNMYEDLKDLTYNAEDETVTCTYWGSRLPDGGRETCKIDINVACDSNAAMIHDVEQRLYKFFS